MRQAATAGKLPVMARRRHRILLVIGSAAFGLTAGACGTGSPSTLFSTTVPGPAVTAGAVTTVAGPRTVNVDMADIKFDTPSVDAKVGETVRFVFHNQGKLTHEAVIGDRAAQDAHEQLMASMAPGMTMTDTADAVSVPAGKTGELTYAFKTTGQLFIGCHQPGHYAAGMRIIINVSAH